eukprot:3333430-Alexandrium_andersonii.AAC.1
MCCFHVGVSPPLDHERGEISADLPTAKALGVGRSSTPSGGSAMSYHFRAGLPTGCPAQAKATSPGC